MCWGAKSFHATVLPVNPVGKFVIGGPDNDCCLTGKKLVIVYSGQDVPFGGSPIYGKDPNKVDLVGPVRAT
ncbi:MAG: hypothetical protein EXS02_12160 [Planctomycetes bacterium]|nr:hypothetical protein [Planctomycetota bacterium]